MDQLLNIPAIKDVEARINALAADNPFVADAIRFAEESLVKYGPDIEKFVTAQILHLLHLG